jgi:hypothetical protein
MTARASMGGRQAKQERVSGTGRTGQGKRDTQNGPEKQDWQSRTDRTERENRMDIIRKT